MSLHIRVPRQLLPSGKSLVIERSTVFENKRKLAVIRLAFGSENRFAKVHLPEDTPGTTSIIRLGWDAVQSPLTPLTTCPLPDHSAYRPTTALAHDTTA